MFDRFVLHQPISGLRYLGVALIIAGICAIGFWKSYDIKCGGFGGGKTWVWTEFPPQYKCSAF